MLTLQEHWGTLANRTIAFVGDGNNVATSLAHASVMLGVTVNVAVPEGFELPDRVVDETARVARSGASVRQFTDPSEAVRSADAVYTDAWASMGQESELSQRRAIFLPYQANAALMAQAKPGALFMHCLPTHRGSEVTDEVIDAPTSVVFDHAENRHHTENAMLSMLIDTDTVA